MKYELLYECKYCKERFGEILNEEEIREHYGLLSDIMSTGVLFELFRNGWEIHRKCLNGYVSYGRIVAIRPVEE